LVAPVLDSVGKDLKINKLRFVPDSYLAYLPFELLTTHAATTWKGNTVPYLLKDYAVSYAYALRQDKEAVNRFNNTDFGGFGIEYDDATLSQLNGISATELASRGGKLSRLVFADDEVKDIYKLLGNGKMWLNVDATKWMFMQNASKFGILHLAMHGSLDEKNPLNSALIFSKKDSSDDNLLRGYDLYAMQLKAGLAVLSACNTGSGTLQRGEGIMSMARAFAYAGCPSTVVSLWSIPDESTSKVMLSFYDNLKKGDTKDVALQKAKLTYLETCPPQYSIPNYWGATVVIGDTSAVDFTPFYKKWWFLLGILAVLVLFIVAYRSLRL
jgi:CHAT domain-containing protein